LRAKLTGVTTASRIRRGGGGGGGVGKQGGREERGLEARIPAADGPERGTQTPLPIRACSPSARSRTGGGPERDVRRGGPSLKARKSPSLPRCCL
ncbi:unnamed protein product, partial [Prorocentrum cordatum]